MVGLEKLINRVKLAMGLDVEDTQIRGDLLAQHIDKDLVEWAIRSARFEINQEERRDDAR